MNFCHVLMEIYLNIGHIVFFLANVRMLKFESELRNGIRSPYVRTPVDIPSFYHIWAWRPSWSCDLDHLYKLSFPLPKDAPHEVWL